MKLLFALAVMTTLISQAYAESLSIHGSTTVAGIVMMPHKDAIEKSSGVSLEIVANGSGNGVMDLVAGKAQMAMISAPLPEVVQSLKEKGANVAEDGLVSEQIGLTRVAFITHPNNPVKSLTFAQLTDILTGKVTSWKDVGGPDKPIIVIVEAKGGGLRSMVEKEMLHNVEITAQKKEVPGAQLVPKIASQLENALGIASASKADASIQELSTDQKLEQPLYLVTKGTPNEMQAKVIASAKSAAGS